MLSVASPEEVDDIGRGHWQHDSHFSEQQTPMGHPEATAGPFDPSHSTLGHFAAFAIGTESGTIESGSFFGGLPHGLPAYGDINDTLDYAGPSQSAFTAGNAGAQRSGHHYTDPGVALNSLPFSNTRRLYTEYSGRLNTLSKARAYLRSVRWTPPPSRVPETDEQKRGYIQRLYECFTDFTNFYDNVTSQNKVNRLIEHKYAQEFIEARCVEILVFEIHLQSIEFELTYASGRHHPSSCLWSKLSRDRGPDPRDERQR
jgi:hypothetical protein